MATLYQVLNGKGKDCGNHELLIDACRHARRENAKPVYVIAFNSDDINGARGVVAVSERETESVKDMLGCEVDK